MAPIQPGSAAEKSLPLETLRAEKHRVIHALEKQKLNPVYSHVQRDIAQAQATLQRMSVETRGTEVKRIVQEAKRRRLVERYEDSTMQAQGERNWLVMACCLVLVIYLWMTYR